MSNKELMSMSYINDISRKESYKLILLYLTSKNIYLYNWSIASPNYSQRKSLSEFCTQMFKFQKSLSNCERPNRFYTRFRHLSKVRINFMV